MNCQSPEPLASAIDGPCETGPLLELFARSQAELLGTLYCVVGNLEDARDALQETFLKCWRHREELAEIDNVKAWVFRVALNTGRDCRSAAWRRKRQPLPPEANVLVASDSSPQASLERAEQLAQLRAAIARLRPEEQEVFLLRQNAGLSYDEISRTIETPLGTVKTRMRMALARLREAVANDE
jgi:RNA polymerase sigma-70 factor (ECF subfamily)